MPRENPGLAELQAILKHENATWEAGVTELSALSADERVLRLGYRPGPGEESLEARIESSRVNLTAAMAAAVGYPSSYDLRNVGGKNFITPIRNQGGCGSCVAFGTAATVEGTQRVLRGDPNLAADFSEAQLFYCIAKSQGRNCANGWWVGPALDGFKNPGIVDEACFPYTAGDQNCKLCSDWQNRVTKITAWHTITNPSQMKEWLSGGKGPLATCFTVYDDFFSYRSGVYHHVTGGLAGGHCVCCVGYDDTQRCWICKNSWGAGWGDSGFFRIAYGDCGIDSTMWAVDGIEATGWQYNKRVIGLWAIDQTRNAWVYVDGLGWRKISPDNDNIFFSMLAELVLAKAAARPVNFHEVQGTIKQVYVL
ncbi:MAG TPA: C1 family peptidase [Candidatus Eisenbacteria bacterium]